MSGREFCLGWKISGGGKDNQKEKKEEEHVKDGSAGCKWPWHGTAPAMAPPSWLSAAGKEGSPIRRP
jgi:hypothetical protein